MRKAWWVTKITFLLLTLLMTGVGLPTGRADEGGRCKGGSCVKSSDNSCYCNGDWCVGCHLPEGTAPGNCGSCVGKPGGGSDLEVILQ